MTCFLQLTVIYSFGHTCTSITNSVRINLHHRNQLCQAVVVLTGANSQNLGVAGFVCNNSTLTENLSMSNWNHRVRRLIICFILYPSGLSTCNEVTEKLLKSTPFGPCRISPGP